jgi:2-(1,2-epoxy-1,2-dihydrophenyl)acetyl-CoA isomerase
MTYETIEFRIANGVAEIMLARPGQANTVTPQFSRELNEVAKVCEDDASIRAVLLYAADGPIFSAGGDLGGLAAAGDNIGVELAAMLADFHPAMQRLATMNAPLIVAVNGVAAGAGFSMVLAGSFIVATAKARFSMAYTGAGLTPDGSSTYFLPRIVGIRRAEELMLTNRQLSAQEALDWGIVNQLVEETELLEKARQTAQRIAKGPTQAFGNVRSLLMDSFDSTLDAQLEREAESILQAINSADGREGIKAFLEKRRPDFKGR